MAERHQPAEREHEVQAHGKQTDDDDVGHQNRQEGITEEWHGRQRSKQGCSGQARPGTKGGDGLFGCADLAMLAGDLLAAEQSVRPHQQDDGHHDEHQHQCALRQETHAEDVDDGDQHRGDEGA